MDFSDGACKVLLEAQREARELGHKSVDGEHVLLGLCSDRDGIPGRVLADLGITIESVRDLVRERLEPAFGARPEWPRSLSLGAKSLLEDAGRAARTIPTARSEQGEALIGAEHLLLGITRLSESGAHQILRSLGADPNVIRFEVKKQVRPSGSREPGAAAELRLIGTEPLTAESEFAQALFDSFLADPAVQRLLTTSAQIAFDEQRARFGMRDLLRALTRDKEASDLLAGLGVKLDALRDQLDTQPPASA